MPLRTSVVGRRRCVHGGSPSQSRGCENRRRDAPEQDRSEDSRQARAQAEAEGRAEAEAQVEGQAAGAAPAFAWPTPPRELLLAYLEANVSAEQDAPTKGLPFINEADVLRIRAEHWRAWLEGQGIKAPKLEAGNRCASSGSP